MAKLTPIQGGSEFDALLYRLAEDSEEASKEAVRAGAGLLADRLREDYQAVLGEDSTGQMLKAMGITPVKLNSKGWWNAKIGFEGYDLRKSKSWPKGVPHQLKARVIESGRKGQKRKKHQIVKKALKTYREQVLSEMEQTMRKRIDQMTK